MRKTDRKLFSRLNLMKAMVWLIIILMIAITFYILYYINFQEKNNIFSDIIFSSSLNFIFSIIGFIVALIIFLIQYIGTKFDSQELDKFPISNKYFIITPIILFFFIIFNLMALYLELVFPYTLISLIFSIFVIVLVGQTVMFSVYYLDISNIVNNISEQTIQFIKEKKSFKKLPFAGEVGYSDEFIILLKKKISVFIKTIIEATNKNQDKVLRTSLECLDDIVYNYLEQSKDVQSTEDKFLDELNDQFNFIISEGLKSYNQKILENIAETIGNISLNIIEYRKGIGDVNNFALNWVSTLKDLFIKSYSKDRTIVCHICLEKINQVILSTLDKGYYRSYDSYKMFLDEISEILSKVNHSWSAILLQKTLLMYQHQFLKFLQLSKSGRIISNDYFIKPFFDKLAKIINEAKNIHRSFGNNAIIFASLFGLNSFAQKIALTGLTDLKDDKIKRNINEHIKQLLEFNKKILENNPEKNDNRIYDSFSEILFLITKYIDMNDNDRELLIESLTNNLLDFVQSEYIKSINYDDNNRLHQLKEATIDYFALLIYLHNNKPILIKKIIHRFADIYLNIKNKAEEKGKNHITKSLYRELKLYSCWVNIFDNLKDKNMSVIKILKQDFYEPSFSHRILITSLFEKYGYPESNISMPNEFWFLHPSDMWGNKFQKEISDRLNGDKGKIYIEFHEMLKG